MSGIDFGSVGGSVSGIVTAPGPVGFVGSNTAAIIPSLGAGVGVDAGSHIWVSVNVASVGGTQYEVTPGNPSSPLTVTAGNGVISLTNCGIGPSGTVARHIYRSKSGTTSPVYYVGTIPDNTTTVFTDSVPDSSLGQQALNIASFSDMTFLNQLDARSVNIGPGSLVNLPGGGMYNSGGFIQAAHMRISDPNTPTFSNIALGTSPTGPAMNPVSPQSNDHKGFITFTVGSTPTAAGRIFTVTFGSSHGQKPIVMLNHSFAGTPPFRFHAASESTTLFDVYCDDVIPAGTPVILSYWAMS